MPKQYSKIRYQNRVANQANMASKEIGWVKKKSKNEYVIANIPFNTSSLNIDDVVTLTEEKDDDGYKFVDRVVERKFHHKTIISYSEIADYQYLSKQYECDEFKIEGGWPPRIDEDGQFQKGMAVIASNHNKKEIQNILKNVGANIVDHFEMI